MENGQKFGVYRNDEGNPSLGHSFVKTVDGTKVEVDLRTGTEAPVVTSNAETTTQVEAQALEARA